jgi:hypothetical protein
MKFPSSQNSVQCLNKYWNDFIIIHNINTGGRMAVHTQEQLSHIIHPVDDVQLHSTASPSSNSIIAN